MQKHVNLVDLVKSFPTNIFLQNLASIQQRTSPIKFDHLDEKSEKGPISNLSTKAAAAKPAGGGFTLDEVREAADGSGFASLFAIHNGERTNFRFVVRRVPRQIINQP